MKEKFTNSSHVECIFTDEGVTFCGDKQDVFMPYGCIDSINMSLMGILQATSHARVCTFAVDRKDRSAIKALIKQVRELMKTAPRAELQMIDRAAAGSGDSAGLSPEEQLKHYKTLFVQGVISHEEYEIRKNQLKG